MRSFHRFLYRLVICALFGMALPAYAQKIRVITTTPELADITKQIGKELVDVESLTRGVEYMHAVPVKPSFVPRLNRADILAVMGLDLEVSWLPALLEVANNPKILPGQTGHIDCSIGVNVIEIPRTLDRTEGDVHPKGNPHYNLDPANGRIIARNITAGLSRNYPQHKTVFEKNLSAYLDELEKAIARWQSMAAPLKGVRFVSYHRDWNYFAERFGLQQVGMIEVRPGIEPTPKRPTVARVMRSSASSSTAAATPASAKSPLRRATSPNPNPTRPSHTGKRVATSTSSSANAVDQVPVKNSLAAISRDPLGPEASNVASSASATAGSSDAGSA